MSTVTRFKHFGYKIAKLGSFKAFGHCCGLFLSKQSLCSVLIIIFGGFMATILKFRILVFHSKNFKSWRPQNLENSAVLLLNSFQNFNFVHYNESFVHCNGSEFTT